MISGSNADDGGGFETDIRLYDLDRVEVLRGPQGTLYGASSMSGTIRFMPKLPELNKVEGYVTAEFSDTAHTPQENYNFNGAVNLPLVEGDAGAAHRRLEAVRLGLHQSDSRRQRRRLPAVAPVGVNNDDVEGGRVALRYQPFEDLTIDANFTTQTETSDGSSRWTPPGVTAFSGGPIPPIQGCDLCNTDVTQSPWSDNLKVFGLTVNYNTHVGTVTATTNQFNRRTSFNFDSTPILIHFGVPIPARDPRAAQPQGQLQRAALRECLRFSGQFRGGRLPRARDAGSGGLRSSRPTRTACRTASSAPRTPTMPWARRTAIRSSGARTLAARPNGRDSAKLHGKPTDALTAVVGVRYFTESLDGVQTQTHPFGGFPPDAPNLVPIADPHQTFNKVTWKENVSYKFSDALLAYETVSTGFRSGGLNAVSEPFEPIPKSYAPDSLINFELGTKGRLFEGRLDYQLDAYFIRWDNIQVQENTADQAFVYLGQCRHRAHQGRRV